MFYADTKIESEAEPGGGSKRLPVMLHDVPENYSLIQRLGDEDVSMVRGCGGGI